MKLRNLKGKISFLLALVMIMFAFVACAAQPTEPSGEPAQETSADPGESTDPGTEADPGTSEEPMGIQAGTVFKYWINYDIPAYLPWLDNRGSALFYQIYDNLLYKHHNDKDDIRGNLAESWTVSEDGLEWVFKIKENAKFTSGNPVNAEAFVASWDAAKEYNPRYFAPVESYTATGEFELTVKLHSPSATFIYDLPMQPNCGVVDPAALEEFGAEDNQAAIGCGPYYVEKYTSGEGFVLKANPDYHNPDRAPSIETCELVVIPDENTALIALMNEELDCMNTVNIEVYNNLMEKNWDVVSVEDRVNPYWFNAREVEIFKDDAVREALCHMVDWQAATDLVYDGLYPVSKSYWAGPGMVEYSDKYSYNPELGLQMLADAGYKPEDIKFTLLADPDFTNINIAIQAQLQELGLVNVEAVTYDGATCYGMLKGGTYEMFPCHNGYGVESPLTPFSMGLLSEGSQRVMWLDQIDEARYAEALKIYEEANIAPDFDTYISKVEELTALIQDECLAMGGIQTIRFYGISPKFTGMYVAPITGYIDFCYLRAVE